MLNNVDTQYIDIYIYINVDDLSIYIYIIDIIKLIIDDK